MCTTQTSHSHTQSQMRASPELSRGSSAAMAEPAGDSRGYRKRRDPHLWERLPPDAHIETAAGHAQLRQGRLDSCTEIPRCASPPLGKRRPLRCQLCLQLLRLLFHAPTLPCMRQPSRLRHGCAMSAPPETNLPMAFASGKKQQ